MKAHCLLLLVLVSCRSPGRSSLAVPTVSLPADEQALIGQAIGESGSVGPGPLILARQTDSPTQLGDGPGRDALLTRRIARALFLAYDSANAHPVELESPVRVGNRTVRFEDEAPPVLSAGREVWHVTRVGFNAARDSGIVGVSRVCGPTCGFFSVKLYVRSVDGWRLATSIASGNY